MERNFMKIDVAQASCLRGGRASRLPIMKFKMSQTPGKMPGVPIGVTPVLR
jgi:hypothetical protein